MSEPCKHVWQVMLEKEWAAVTVRGFKCVDCGEFMDCEKAAKSLFKTNEIKEAK